jgi:hypothetical protein
VRLFNLIARGCFPALCEDFREFAAESSICESSERQRTPKRNRLPLLDELQRHGIHAIAQTRRLRAVIEHVPQMGVALGAGN